MREPLRENGAMFLAGCLAVVLVIVRACIQSVTIDEASLFLSYVHPDLPTHWYATSGNHVLISVLARLFIYLFGLSQVTFRAPTLIGAVIYIIAVYKLCILGENRTFRLGLFLCLVYNPFVLDFMVAARGYGLALAFLITAISILARQLLAGPGDPLFYRRSIWISVCSGLSLCASLPFAYVVVILLSTYMVWSCWERWKPSADAGDRIREGFRIVAACILPGALVVFVICGSFLRDFQRSELYYGAKHLRETWDSLVQACFFELNPSIANPLVESTLSPLQPLLPTLLIALTLLLLWMFAASRQWLTPGRQQRLAILEVLLLGTLALTFLTHWLGFVWLKIPLPRDRTGIYFVPLSMLVFAVAFSACRSVPFARPLRALGIALLWIGAFYFVACLRLAYFKEWKYDADAKSAYWSLDYLRRQYGIVESYSTWPYADVLNFYRVYYSNPYFPVYQDLGETPRGKCAYVLESWQSREFIASEKLQIFEQGALSGMVVAVRPECLRK
jgi:hypothetical protein